MFFIINQPAAISDQKISQGVRMPRKKRKNSLQNVLIASVPHVLKNFITISFIRIPIAKGRIQHTARLFFEGNG